MFEHLSFLLDNATMLLARPSLRGLSSKKSCILYFFVCTFTTNEYNCLRLLLCNGLGSVPLDVAYSSFMDNNELALALKEEELDKLTVYLSRCGLQV